MSDIDKDIKRIKLIMILFCIGAILIAIPLAFSLDKAMKHIEVHGLKSVFEKAWNGTKEGV